MIRSLLGFIYKNFFAFKNIMFFQCNSYSRFTQNGIFSESSKFSCLHALLLQKKTTDQVPSVLSRNLFWDKQNKQANNDY